jgi:catechol 2,3-dioxygenase
VGESIHPQSRIGHVHLKVSDLDRSEAFYREVVGFEVTMRGEGLVFMSAGGYHHHLALNSTMSEGKVPAPADTPGLLHFAILFPRHVDLVRAARRAIARGVRFHRASDYGYSVAVYMRDPDGNEIELAWDRDPSGVAEKRRWNAPAHPRANNPGGSGARGLRRARSGVKRRA